MTLKPLIIANWKMNVMPGPARAMAKAANAYLLRTPICAELVICPALESIERAAREITSTAIRIGAQVCSAYATGAHTGEVSPLSLEKLGCRYVIVGHSERRKLGETDKDVSNKTRTILSDTKMTPIVCIGESAAEKKSSKTHAVLMRQVTAAFSVASNHKQAARIIIAYEPIWAIGTGNALAMDVFLGTVAALGKILPPSTRVLYGGSVDQKNVRSFVDCTDGVLVGSASQSLPSLLSLLKKLTV